MSFFAGQLPEASDNVSTIIPVIIVCVPLAGSLITFFAGKFSERARDLGAVITSVLTFLLVLQMYPLVKGSILYYNFNFVLQFGIQFRVDFVSFVFAVLFSFVWMLATIFSIVYMKHEHAKSRYYIFLLSTLGHALGVVLAGDFITLFIFFELMTLSSYVLVIHEETPEAMAAGRVYIYMGIAGGLALLMGIFLLYVGTGSLLIRPMLEEISAANVNPVLIIVLFLIGFGVKAGMVPLHIWLPKAHPVAPSPASALLSGIMIKVGAYGIFRVLLMVFTPAHIDEHLVHEVNIGMQFGLAVIWMGILTMFLGASMALLQTNSKRILAYSSVSQMGYILLGIGCGAYLGYEGAMGFAGALYHMINHAIFKSGLFLMVGAIYITTHQLDFEFVRGMIRKTPFIAVTFIIAAFGIGGIPGFNGFASKTLIHDALLEAYHHYHTTNLYIAEKIFTLTSAMTISYFIKLFRGLFLGEVPEKYDRKDYSLSLSPLVKIILGIFAALIIVIGVFPNLLMDKLIIPAMNGFTLDHHFIEHHLVGFHFFGSHPLEPVPIVIGLAIVITLAGNKLKAFDWKPPCWLSVEYLLYNPLARSGRKACEYTSAFDHNIDLAYMSSAKLYKLAEKTAFLDSKVDTLYQASADTARKIADTTKTFDEGIDGIYGKSGDRLRRLAERTRQFDEGLNDLYDSSGETLRRAADGTKQFDASLNDIYDESGRVMRRMANGTKQFDASLNDIYDESGRVMRHMADGTRQFEQVGEAGKRKKKQGFLGRLLHWTPGDFNIKNLNFDTLLMVVMLAIFLIILVYFSTFQ